MATAVDERIDSLIDGRYRISESMDSGSMGAVYKAERVPVGKIVAIKFLHASYANDSEFLARFERETRVMSKLAHPNCVSVVDFGVWQGNPYLVMEFVSGRTLRKIIDGGALPPCARSPIARRWSRGWRTRTRGDHPPRREASQHHDQRGDRHRRARADPRFRPRAAARRPAAATRRRPTSSSARRTTWRRSRRSAAASSTSARTSTPWASCCSR